MKIHRWRPDPDNPIGVGRCQISNFIVPRNELVKQMQYAGNALVWTGLYVWYKFADKPNPSLLTPLLKADPAPIPHPLPDDQPAFNILTESRIPILEENNLNLVTD